MWTQSLIFVPQNEWQCSEPIDGEYFQVRSFNAPAFATFMIAQVEFETIGMKIFDLQEVPATTDYIVFNFKKPPVFTDRRIAVIQTRDFEAPQWGIELWVSDYVSPDSSGGGDGDGEPAYNPLTAIAANPFLWTEGTLDDYSENENNLVAGSKPPTAGTGINGNPALVFDGTQTQEVSAIPLPSNTTAVHAFTVITIDPDSSHYTILKTANNDSYWRFAANGAGYFGSFRASRAEGYPASMPGSGSHLIEICATANTYEVLIDTVSQGVISNQLSMGDRLVFGANDRPFKGSILLAGIYERVLSDADRLKTLQHIKSRFALLPFTLPS